MSRKNVISAHNKNVLDFMNICYRSQKNNVELKKDLGYIDNPIFNLFYYKQNMVNFYNKVVKEYNMAYNQAELQLTYLEKEQKKFNNTPKEIEKLNQTKAQLLMVLNQKDENYEKCVDIFTKRNGFSNDLNAEETYTEQVTTTERVPKTKITYMPMYNPATKTTMLMPHSSIVYENVTRTKTVTKTRPDEAKRNRAKLEIEKLDKEIEQLPTYKKNIESYLASDKIEKIDAKINEINEYLKVANEIKEGYIIDYKICLEKAKKLLNILENEKQLIDQSIKNPSKKNLDDVNDLDNIEKEY